ncbi:MAG: DoxX family protein [Rhizomicrobium sp.]
MLKLSWRRVLVWALAAFFLFGGFGNLFAPPAIIAEYRGWGYPAWFHFATATLEFATALLLVLPAARLMGIALGGTVMFAASITVLFRGELGHAAAPLIVLALLALSGWAALRFR